MKLRRLLGIGIVLGLVVLLMPVWGAEALPPRTVEYLTMGGKPPAGEPPVVTSVDDPTRRAVTAEILFDKHTGQPLPGAEATIAESTPQQRAEIEAQEQAKRAAINPAEIVLRSKLKLSVEPGMTAGARQTLEAAALADSAGAPAYLIIQFPDGRSEAARAQLETAGVTLFDYFKSYAFTTKAPASALSLLDEMLANGRLRYVGQVPALSKIEASLVAKGQANPSEAFPVIVQFYEAASDAQLDAVRPLMQVNEYKEGALQLVIGTARGENLLALAELPFTRWVEEAVMVTTSNLESTMATGGDHAVAGGYSGAGIRVSVVDSGIARDGTTYHQDLPSPRIADQYDFYNDDSNASDDRSHGTHCAGTIGGAGVVSDSFRGNAPACTFLIYKILNADGQCFGDCHFDDALSRSASHDANVSSNSWGGGNGSYNTLSEWADKAVRGFWDGSDGNPQYINVVVSTGNDNNLVSYPASGKNTIAVGAVKDGNYVNTWNPCWTACCDTDWPPGERVCFSNYGPLDTDGNGYTRVKPDLVAPGVRTFSTAPWYLYGDNRMYQYKDGTSMATPAVAGAIADALSYYDGSPGTDLRNWPEMVKAAFLATAINVGANTNFYGRGMANVYNVLWANAANDAHFWGNSVSSDGEEKTFTFSVPSGFAEVRVVLVWNDPPGSTEGINDLDLRVYDAGGTLRASSTSYDDNVEYVRATSGTAGTWQFKVRAYDITQSPPQYFGLAVNVVKQLPALSLSASASDSSIAAGDSFYIEADLSNSGYAAAGTWVGVDPPAGFNLTQTCVYPRDSSRVFCYDDSASNWDGTRWRAATGEVVLGLPRTVRWHFQSDGGLTPGNRNFVVSGGGREVASPTARTLVVNIEDITPPSNPTSIWSTSHITATWSSDTTVEVCWSGASDNYSGIGGYGLFWSHSPVGIPSAIVDTVSTCDTSTALATDNDWYFHLRTVDGAGNWTPGTVHLGPFYIDGTNPPAPVLTETHTGPGWSNHNTPYYDWDAVTDVGSGMNRYEYSLDSGSATSLGLSTYHHPSLADGSHSYKVRAVDNVGRISSWSNTLWRYIDTVAPSSSAYSPLTSTTCFVVTWSGSDERSGVASYDLQSKVGAGSWVNWITDTAATSATFCGIGGNTYYFGSRAEDNASNVEAWPSVADSSTYVVPDYRPGSSVFPISPYWHNTSSFRAYYSASDDGWVTQVGLYYRYSTNGTTWSGWSLFATDSVTGSLVSDDFLFTCPSGQGYYEFYTLATDNSGKTEVAPVSADAAAGYDATRPTNPAPPATESHGVVSGTWQTAVSEPSFTWGTGSDSLSGIAGYWVYWGGTSFYTTTRTYTPDPVEEGTTTSLWILAKDSAGNLASLWSLQFVFQYGAVPVANFAAAPLTGTAPLNVSFTDLSTGTITSRLWNFGDGEIATNTNPVHTYDTAGAYTVSLTADGPAGTDTEVKANYIHVYNPVRASFTASPTFGTAPLVVTFTDASTGDVASRLWNFGDGVTATLQSPVHTYTSGGVYTVSLRVTGLGGDVNTEVKRSYITVLAEGTLQGWVWLQGRASHEGTTVAAGPYTAATAPDGSFAFDLAPGVYTVTAGLPGYLYAQRSGVGISSVTALPEARLVAGDAVWDGTININDLTLVGANFGLAVPPGDARADINGDNAVNIFDIVLVGANYGLAAPRPWP